MTVPNNTNLTATTAQVMPSPMDDLPVVIPSYAGQHPAGTVIVGAYPSSPFIMCPNPLESSHVPDPPGSIQRLDAP